MNRVYTVEFEGTAVTAAVDLFELRPADDKPIIVHAMYLSQSTELGDAAEEVLRYRVIRGNTTTGTGGTSPTPRPVNDVSAAAGFAADVLNTTAATVGTEIVLHSGGWNIRMPEQLVLTPECRWVTRESAGFLVVRLMAAPADSITMSGVLYVEEV